MGNCKYCGQSCGLFSKSHQECENKHKKGLSLMELDLNSYFKSQKSINEVSKNISQYQKDYYINCDDIISACEFAIIHYTDSLHFPIEKSQLILVDDFLKNLPISKSNLNKNGALDKLSARLYHGILLSHFVEGTPFSKIQLRVHSLESVVPVSQMIKREEGMNVLNKAATKYMKNGQLTNQEEQLIDDFAKQLSICLTDLPENLKGSDIEKVSQALILKKLETGIMPPTMPLTAPVVLAPNEIVLWEYSNISMYNEKIEREFIGRSSGFSFTVMKGVRYHVGGGKGHPIEHSRMNLDAIGQLIVTNNNLIFYSPKKMAKVPFKKIIGITPYSDGLEIHKDGANTKRQIFQGFDPWFTMNLLSHMGNIN